MSPEPIRFSCPKCQAKLKVSQDKAGSKAPCPKCGQRLEVPPPPAEMLTSKTMLGDIEFPPLPNKTILGDIELTPEQSTSPTPEQTFNFAETPSVAPAPIPVAPTPIAPIATIAAETKTHSGYGIASFLIAILVGGLDCILAIVIACNVASSSSSRYDYTYNRYYNRQAAATEAAAAGGLALVCLNCMSIPACIIGVGLSIVGLTTQKTHHHIYTWIGLFGNGIVILGMVGLFLLGVAAGRH